MRYAPATDDIGKRFGRLTILSLYYKDDDPKKHAWAVCKCDCKKEYHTKLKDMRYGSIVSCGCFGKEKTSKIFRKVLIGQKFGSLNVIEFADRVNGCGHCYWVCECDCGNIVERDGAALRRGQARLHCGCLTPKSNRPRSEEGYSAWVKQVKIRDNFICRMCYSNDNPTAHHIFNYLDNPELRTDLKNGICLCRRCHVMFHSLYGLRNTTQEQLDEFQGYIRHQI